MFQHGGIDQSCAGQAVVQSGKRFVSLVATLRGHDDLAGGVATDRDERGSRSAGGVEPQPVERALVAAFEMQARHYLLSGIAAFLHADRAEAVETEPLRQ